MNVAVAEAAARQYDLVVVGGGVQGLMLALEATHRGLTPLVLERDVFGGATSANSLRILHGGLRYLQSLDLVRHRAALGEQRWFRTAFPEHVRPLPVLMPLYGEGLRRPGVLGAALLADRLLGAARNRGVAEALRLPPGRLLGRNEALARCPHLRRSGLQGAALWHDAVMPDVPALLEAARGRALAAGACMLAGVTVDDLQHVNGRVRGVAARAGRAHDLVAFRAPLVVNATGPWVRALACRLDRDYPALFHPLAAWNVLFDRPALSKDALAVTPPGGGRALFLTESEGRLLAGTGQATRPDSCTQATVSREEQHAFLDALNRALPGLDLSESDVVRTFVGLRPGKTAGALDVSRRDVVVDHGRAGGPAGLWSVSGVKLTTARLLAERVLDTALEPA